MHVEADLGHFEQHVLAQIDARSPGVLSHEAAHLQMRHPTCPAYEVALRIEFLPLLPQCQARLLKHLLCVIPMIYSFHSGSANVLMCDVSVRGMRANVALQVVSDLITRAEGEQISSDAF